MAAPPIRPQRWTPPPAPGLEGPWAPTGSLTGLQRWPVPGEGPEDVTVGADGQIYTGLRDGRVVAVSPGGHRVAGRLESAVLGIEALPDGRLLLCGADAGLVALDPDTGATEHLLGQVEGRPLVLTNNATVRRDGTILFTESSTRFRLEHFRADLLEHSATGALWQLDPERGTVERLRTGLAFANGVTLEAGERFAVLAETGAYRLHRIWLTGDRAGESEIFCENLPGMPDNLSTGPDGTIWCAMPSLRVPSLDAVLPRHPVIRKLIHRLPDSLQPDAVQVGFVLGFDETGEVRANLQSDGREYSWITGVREHDGWLYLSSLQAEAIARYPLP